MLHIGNGHKDVLMIGDTIHDFEVANEVGADCVLISAGHQPYQKLKETGAKVFNTLSEFELEFFNKQI
jgi:phosphoglycolate phosphatase